MMWILSQQPSVLGVGIQVCLWLEHRRAIADHELQGSLFYEQPESGP